MTKLLLLLAAGIILLGSCAAALDLPPHAPIAAPTPPPLCAVAPSTPVVVDLPPPVVLANPSPPPGLLEMLKRDEGLRLKTYRDTRGNWTVGFGRNLSGRGITEKEALHLLQNDILGCQTELDEYLAWWKLLSAPRQIAMIGMCYNLGIHGLREFKNALAAMESGDYKAAARHFMNSRWARQVGKRARQLSRMVETNEVPNS